MLRGLTITPPVLGRISIGKVVEKNGKRLPEKDDQFTLTSQVQSRDGWLLHPLNEELRNGQDGKLRSIPIRLLFNEPDLNFRADYSLFDRTTGRPLCVGNGETCKRLTKDGIQSLPCPSPDGCSLAQGGACKPYGRLNVVIGDDDPLGSFVFAPLGSTASVPWRHACSISKPSPAIAWPVCRWNYVCVVNPLGRATGHQSSTSISQCAMA